MTDVELVAELFPNGEPKNYKNHALILDSAAVQAMQSAQEQVGSKRHKVQPVETTDGRYLISADIIPELAAGGIFEPAMAYFDGSALSGVEVMSWADGVALLPKPDLEDI